MVPPSTPSNRGGGRGRGGRGGNRRQNHAELSEVEKRKIKQYKLKYDKYLKLKPVTNSPFDILIKATQVMMEMFDRELFSKVLNEALLFKKCSKWNKNLQGNKKCVWEQKTYQIVQKIIENVLKRQLLQTNQKIIKTEQIPLNSLLFLLLFTAICDLVWPCGSY